jgi:GT2 family glycosyltransferase
MTIAPLEGPQCPTPPTLAIVIVNFNSWPDCERLVGVMAAALGRIDGRCEVILVDNASDAPPPSGLQGRSGIRVLLRPDNAGFATGVNTAWRQTAARWLLLLNPDTLADADLPGKILARIDAYEARPSGPPGIVGFALSNEDGTRQHSVGSFPTLLGCLREAITPRSRRKYWPLARTRPGPVPWVTGACMLVRSEMLEQLGGMDEEFFLYHEEVALCRSARDLGWEVAFDDSVEVAHLRPLQSRPVSPRLRVVTRHSKLLYFLKHRPSWEFAILARIVLVESRLRRLFSSIAGRRDESRAWAAVDRLARELGPEEGPRGGGVLELADRFLSGVEIGMDRGPRPGPTPRVRARSIPLDVTER